MSSKATQADTAVPAERLRVNMISETTFTVRGHGVHTAFLEMTNSLKARPDVDIKVNTFRAADIIHIQTIGPYSLLHALFGRGRKVISAHVIPDSYKGSIVGAQFWYGFAVWYLRFFYNRADRILAVSEEVKSALLKQLKVKPPVDVVFNTINSANYAPSAAKREAARNKLRLTQDEYVVVSNGQVQPRKRYDVFVKLAKQYPKWRFFWVGGIPFKRLGADYDEMQKLMDSAPSNLTTTGVIELSEVKTYYMAADSFILASNQENHPLAVLEAAASGLPVVIRDIPEYDSSFGQDAVRGTDETFGKILDRLRTDPGYRRKAVEGSRRIAERFDSSSGAKALIAAYELALEPPAAAEPAT